VLLNGSRLAVAIYPRRRSQGRGRGYVPEGGREHGVSSIPAELTDDGCHRGREGVSWRGAALSPADRLAFVARYST
jgi:hypothetical protein